MGVAENKDQGPKEFNLKLVRGVFRLTNEMTSKVLGGSSQRARIRQVERQQRTRGLNPGRPAARRGKQRGQRLNPRDAREPVVCNQPHPIAKLTFPAHRDVIGILLAVDCNISVEAEQTRSRPRPGKPRESLTCC